MARYFFHLHDGVDEILDEDGVELADHAALMKTALVGARDVISAMAKDEGLIDLRPSIEVHDEAGAVVYSLPFTQAVNIVTPDTIH